MVSGEKLVVGLGTQYSVLSTQYLILSGRTCDGSTTHHSPSPCNPRKAPLQFQCCFCRCSGCALMEVISFRCSSCQQPLKVKAAYAGRKTKCKKCGSDLIVPQGADSVPEKAAAAPAKSPFADEEEDSGGAYTLAEAPEPVAEQPKAKKKDAPKSLRTVKKQSRHFA